MRRAALATLVAAAGGLAAAPGAHAQIAVALSGSPADVLRSSQARVQVTGEVVVEFRSDATACAAVGRCGLEGRTLWRPGGRGSLVALELDPEQERRPLVASLVLFGEELGSPRAESRVRRTTADGSRLCADVVPTPGFVTFDGPLAGLDVGLAAAGAEDLLASRCAGPATADLAAALPPRRVTRAQLRRGRFVLDLGGEAPLASPGLVGTVRSTVAVRVGAMRSGRRTGSRDDGAPRTPSFRTLTRDFAIERVAGRVDVELAGALTEGVCAPLDTCGLAGRMTLAPSARAGSFGLYAFARRRVGRGTLLDVLAGRRPAAAGVDVSAGGQWADRGTLSSELRRPGAEAACTDELALEGGLLEGTVRGRRVTVHYVPELGLRGRCGGPVGAEAVASATVPLRALARRRVVLRLRGGRRIATDGFRLRTRPDLTVVLRRR